MTDLLTGRVGAKSDGKGVEVLPQPGEAGADKVAMAILRKAKKPGRHEEVVEKTVTFTENIRFEEFPVLHESEEILVLVDGSAPAHRAKGARLDPAFCQRGAPGRIQGAGGRDEPSGVHDHEVHPLTPIHNQRSRLHGGCLLRPTRLPAAASVAFGPTKRLSLVGNTNP
jgi:hypothetical protein